MKIQQKRAVQTNSIVFIWILLCNFLIQVFLEELEKICFCSWAFFLINILFFLMQEPRYRRRYFQVPAGSLVGILAAGMLTLGAGRLSIWGFSPLISLMIPLALCLGAIIILHPVFPFFFNNCGFAYFLVSLMDVECAYSHMPFYMLSAISGHLIVNTGTLLVIWLANRLFKEES